MRLASALPDSKSSARRNSDEEGKQEKWGNGAQGSATRRRCFVRSREPLGLSFRPRQARVWPLIDLVLLTERAACSPPVALCVRLVSALPAKLNSLKYLFAPAASDSPAAPSPRRSPTSSVVMPAQQWSPARARIQLKLAVQRVRLLAQKRTQLAKSTRREVAALVEKGKIESAKIKVEGLLSEDLYVELLEVLELCAHSARVCTEALR